VKFDVRGVRDYRDGDCDHHIDFAVGLCLSGRLKKR